MRIEDVDYLYDKYMIDRNKKVLLYVGNIKPHKNIERLLEAFSIVLKKDDGWQLVLVGRAFDDYDLLSNISSRFTNKEVLVTGAVSQEYLVGLYNLADLFILPSLYEGFGLIVLEALACGTQVACSNTSSLPEVGGKVVDYFDPYDVDDIADKILNHHIHDQKEIRKHLAEFSWKRTATVFKENVTRILRGNS
jgi:glycosyltransferase involved in cell wall biosynthesis